MDLKEITTALDQLDLSKYELIKKEEIAGKIRDKDGLLFLNTLCYNVTTSDKTDKTTKLSVFVYPMKNHILIAI